jgi:hypothetical protein
MPDEHVSALRGHGGSSSRGGSGRHYLVIVGQLLDQAATGGLRIRLELADGRVVEGVPPFSGEFDEPLSEETGAPVAVNVEGVRIELGLVRRATILYPKDRYLSADWFTSA